MLTFVNMSNWNISESYDNVAETYFLYEYIAFKFDQDSLHIAEML